LVVTTTWPKRYRNGVSKTAFNNKSASSHQCIGRKDDLIKK
jgi:hypothetical protein